MKSCVGLCIVGFFMTVAQASPSCEHLVDPASTGERTETLFHILAEELSSQRITGNNPSGSPSITLSLADVRRHLRQMQPPKTASQRLWAVFVKPWTQEGLQDNLQTQQLAQRLRQRFVAEGYNVHWSQSTSWSASGPGLVTILTLDGLAIGLTHVWLPAWLPKLDLIQVGETDPEDFPTLLQKNQSRFALQRLWNLVRVGFTSAFLISAAPVVTGTMHWIPMAVGLQQVSAQDVQSYSDHVGLNQRVQTQLENWRKAYRSRHNGQDPSAAEIQSETRLILSRLRISH